MPHLRYGLAGQSSTSTMELLTPAFVILLVKITICVVPGVTGIFLLALSEEKKRDLRDEFCRKLLGVSNAIPFRKFERVVLVVGLLGLLFAVTAAWFLLFASMFNK